jgi:hypothetical protein
MTQYRVVFEQEGSRERIAVELPAEGCWNAIQIAQRAGERILGDRGIPPRLLLVSATRCST